MEIHSVLPEERARDAKGDPLPWGYRYAEYTMPSSFMEFFMPNDSDSSTRNPRAQAEESGPFGRNRSLRATSSYGRSTRAPRGTTPVRQKENSAVADFGRLFAKEQAREEEERSSRPIPTTTQPSEGPRIEPEAVPTECLIYGYAGKAAEWKIISKFERIAAPGIICEDYPREDPNLYLSTGSPLGLSRSAVVIHKNLSRDALRKSSVYRGGQHWIKVTFDSYQAAERACFYSPVEIDGYQVYCEMWQGRGPVSDVALSAGSETAELLRRNGPKARTMTPSQSAPFLSGKDSALAGFERAMQTLPRSHTVPDVQWLQPGTQDDSAISETASSATAAELAPVGNNLRSRSTPQLPSQVSQIPTSEYMTHIPNVKKAVLRPIHEALPPQPTFTEKVIRSLPIVSWLIGSKGKTGDVIGEGPLLKDDNTWDSNNGWYWSFWHSVDSWIGTDFCGIKED